MPSPSSGAGAAKVMGVCCPTGGRGEEEEERGGRQEETGARGSICLWWGLPEGRHVDPHSAVRVSHGPAAPRLCPTRPRGAPGRRRLQAGACCPDTAVHPVPLCPAENLCLPPLPPPAWVSLWAFCCSLNLGAGVGAPLWAQSSDPTCVFQAAKLAKMKIPPSEMFLSESDKYSKFDENVRGTFFSLFRVLLDHELGTAVVLTWLRSISAQEDGLVWAV